MTTTTKKKTTRKAKPAVESGVCFVCGCSEFDPCPEGCGWANAQQTLCTNPICLRTAKREARILAAVEKVLEYYRVGPGSTAEYVPHAALERLAKARASFRGGRG
jgi:hypothetical protein